MGNPILKKLNEMINENLAMRVIEEYRDDPEGLTFGECDSMELTDDKCSALRGVLKPGMEGIVTTEERQELADAGFAKEFIKTLAGSDGKKALRARVKWLSQGGFKEFDDIAKHRFVRTAATFLNQELEHCKCTQATKALFRIEPAAKEEADAALAGEILEKYANDYSYGDSNLAEYECVELGVSINHCNALRNVLGRGPDGIITPEEQKLLASAGLAKEAIKTLAGNDGKKALRARVEWLTRQLDHEDRMEAAKAAKALGHIGRDAKDTVPSIIKLLEKSLEDKDPKAIKSFAWVLGLFGPNARAAIPVLAEVLLRSGNPGAEYTAARALGKIGPPAVPKLIEALDKGLKDKNTRLIKAAARGLGDMGPNARDAFPVLAKALRDNNRDVRWEARRTLEEIGPSIVPALTSMITDKSEHPEVREEAMDVLGYMKANAKTAAPILIGLFKNKGENLKIRKNALSTLEKIGADEKTVVPALIAVFEDKDDDSGLRFLYVAESLGKFGPKARAAIYPLAKAWTGKEGWRREIAEALERICSPTEDEDARTEANKSRSPEEIIVSAIPAIVEEWEKDK